MSDYTDDAPETTPPAPALGWAFFQLPGGISKATEARSFGDNTELTLRFLCSGGPGRSAGDRLFWLGRELLAPEPVGLDDVRAGLAGNREVKYYRLFKDEIAKLEQRAALLRAKLKETEAKRETLSLTSPPRGLAAALLATDAELQRLRDELAGVVKEREVLQVPMKHSHNKALREARALVDALARKRPPVFDAVAQARAKAMRAAVEAIRPHLDALAAISLAGPLSGDVVHPETDVSGLVERLADEVSPDDLAELTDPPPVDAPPATKPPRPAPAAAQLE